MYLFTPQFGLLLTLLLLGYSLQTHAHEPANAVTLAPQAASQTEVVKNQSTEVSRADQRAHPPLNRVADKGVIKPNMPVKGEAVMLQGTVRYLHLEGGFWGIVTDNGQHILPKNLPLEYRKDGIRLRFSAQEITGAMTIQQWGKLSHLGEITVIGQVESKSVDPRH